MATKIGQLASELARTNAWWRDPTGWQATDPDLRTVTATGLGYRANVLDDLTPGGLHLLRGPRRVGKTVAVKQAIGALLNDDVRPNAIVRVATDGWSATDIRTVVQNAALPPVLPDTPRWWFFDEITAVTGDWATQIKWLRDNDADFAAATVVLTGSAAAQLTSAAGVLAGRRRATAAQSNRTLLPIGFASFARLLDPSVPAGPPIPLGSLRDAHTRDRYHAMVPWLDTLARCWEWYVRYGGFPAVVAAVRSGHPVPQELADDLFDVVFRDAFAASNLAESTTSALFERVMTAMASPLNMNNIAKDLGHSTETVRRHIGYLSNAYLTWHCPQRADTTWKARARAQDKIYAVDPLVARLAHLRDPARSDIDITVLTEMQLGMALRRSAYAAGMPWAGEDFLFYARTPARKEIDFISEHLGGVAIEGKYTDSGHWHGEAATVNASEWHGILATRNVLDTSATNTAWAVPAAFIAFVLDS